MSYSYLPISSQLFIASRDFIFVSKSIPKVLSHNEWLAAMEEKMIAFETNHTWDTMSLPNDKQLIGCKWVFIVKINPNDIIVQLKA